MTRKQKLHKHENSPVDTSLRAIDNGNDDKPRQQHDQQRNATAAVTAHEDSKTAAIRSGGGDGGAENTKNQRAAKASEAASTPATSDFQRASRKETTVIQILRLTVLLVLFCTAIVVCASIVVYTRNDEKAAYEAEFMANALRIMDSFHDAVESKLNALHALSCTFTSYARENGHEFPFVTLPDFPMHGSAVRAQTDAVIVHWAPLVTDDTREAWERYANATRIHIEDAYVEDAQLRQIQDEQFGYESSRPIDPSEDADRRHRQFLEAMRPYETTATTSTPRSLQQDDDPALVETVVNDGTGYHPRIWTNGSNRPPRGDEPDGSGPYLPLWQRSPVSEDKQNYLNLNFNNVRVFSGVLPVVQETHQAVMHRASIPVQEGRENLLRNLQVGLYRHDIENVIDSPLTWIAYPVFDSFQPASRQLTGILASNIYWKLFFRHILHDSAMRMVCVLENSFNQTNSYMIDGPEVIYLGEGKDGYTRAENNDLELVADINSYIAARAGPESRAYASAPLNQEYGQYTLHIYPADSVEYTDRPWMNALMVFFSFAFTSIVFLIFAWYVERRQRIVMTAAVNNEIRATNTERELNEFLAHEVRNPLAAAISACAFVASTIEESSTSMIDPQLQYTLQEDCNIIDSNLRFVSDFLRSMLDLHRATQGAIHVRNTPTDILKDVLEPVSNMFYQRDLPHVKISVDCPKKLIVSTDCLRLKQVIMNLGRNAAKFVESGFVRFRAEVVTTNGHHDQKNVVLYVEDSGPGIPLEKQKIIFEKYQLSLDVLSEGTGIGLCLCKKLMVLLGGDIWLDESYRSGFGSAQPGARFVVDLQTPPIELSLRRSFIVDTGWTSSTAVLSIQGIEDEDDNDERRRRPQQEVVEKVLAITDAEGESEPARERVFASHHQELNVNVDGSPEAVATDGGCNNTKSQVEQTDVPPSKRNVQVVETHAGPDRFATSNRHDSAVLSPNGVKDAHGPGAVGAVVDDGDMDILLPPQNMSVLFVDDDMILRKLFTRAIQRVAPTWKVNEAVNGETALRLAGSECYDLIFMDQYMASTAKQLLGTETVRALRAQGVQSVICGLSANDHEDAFLNAGADFFLMKPLPCKPTDLKHELLRIMASSSTFSKKQHSLALNASTTSFKEQPVEPPPDA